MNQHCCERIDRFEAETCLSSLEPTHLRCTPPGPVPSITFDRANATRSKTSAFWSKLFVVDTNTTITKCKLPTRSWQGGILGLRQVYSRLRYMCRSMARSGFGFGSDAGEVIEAKGLDQNMTRVLRKIKGEGLPFRYLPCPMHSGSMSSCRLHSAAADDRQSHRPGHGYCDVWRASTEC